MDKEKTSKKTKNETPAPWEGPSPSTPAYQKANSEQMEKLMEENLRMTQEIYKMTKKINNFVVWSRIFGFFKVLVFVAPIILGIIYFKPLLGLMEQAFAPYKELLNMTDSPDIKSKVMQSGVSPSSVEELLNSLKSGN